MSSRSIVAPSTSRTGTKPEPWRWPFSAIWNTMPLGVVDELVRRAAFVFVGTGGNLATDANQLPQQ